MPRLVGVLTTNPTADWDQLVVGEHIVAALSDEPRYFSLALPLALAPASAKYT